ncbi:MAG TPA: hypothetical protein VG167_07020 [Verrucomicrobiae bacterium]|nr:hypothetical protein [Verrucomicrobiae bacterium]
MANGYEEEPLKTVERLLRCRNTHRYFTDNGWTENPADARCFTDLLEAAQICAERGLTDVELTLVAGRGGPELFCTAVR